MDEATGPEDLVMPGHVFLCGRRTGVSCSAPARPRAAVDLAGLAGFKPAGDLRDHEEDGTMARVPDLERFSKEHGVRLVTVAQIMQYRHAFETQVRCAVETRLPTFGEFGLRAYENDIDELTHVALVMGEPEGKGRCARQGPLGMPDRRHIALFALRLRRTTESAMERIAAEGEGVIAYMQQEGRGIGLLNK